MKKYIKQVKKALVALLAAVLVLGSGIVVPQVIYANETDYAVVRIFPESMAITADGTLWAWGRTFLGDGTPIDRRSPVRIMENVAYVIPSISSTFAIRTDEVYPQRER